MRGKPSMINAAVNLTIALFACFCLSPMVMVLAASLSSEEALIYNGYRLWPQDFSTWAYELIIGNNAQFLTSYKVTFLVTIIGTLSAVVVTGAAAFALSNKQVRCRDGISLFFFVTMVFTTGIVPWYIICDKLGLRNNYFALIVPNLLFSPFNLFLTRNFMNSIPDSLAESARIDGANDVTIAFRVYFPLSTPVLATIALFYGLGYWNDWWNAIMLVENKDLFPLQYLLFKIQSEIQMLRDLQSATYSGTTAKPPSETIKMATVILTIGPIVLLFPFLQRYFVKGLVIGSVKG